MKKHTFLLIALSLAVCAVALMTTSCGGSSYTPGEYSSSSKAVHGDVTVTLTVSEKKITGVDIKESGEENSFAAGAYETMTQQIIKKQSADIDGVTGATISTTAVKTAAAAALAEASAGK